MKCGILDSGANKTACCQVWLEGYLGSLPENKCSDIYFYPTSSGYYFGDAKAFSATKKTKLPADIANHKLTIEKTL